MGEVFFFKKKCWESEDSTAKLHDHVWKKKKLFKMKCPWYCFGRVKH
jgi:hypothetical protein